MTRFPHFLRTPSRAGWTRLLSGSLLFLLVLSFAACKRDADAQPDKLAALDPLMTDFMAKYKQTSMAAAIVKKDKIVWSKGYGVANKATNLAATDETVYFVASVSKPVTAVATMQLVEQGRINLDTDINQYLPFRVVNPKSPTAVITCRDLMTHRSGLTDEHYDNLVRANLSTFYALDRDPPIGLTDFCRAFLSPTGQYYNPDTFEASQPGTARPFTYGNLNITLLACVVEAVARQPFDRYCTDKIFVPLGMRKTSWRIADFQLNQLAMMYGANGTPYGHYTISVYPAGGLRTTAQDLSRFLGAVLGNGTWQGQTILSPASVRAMVDTRTPGPSAPGEGIGLVWLQLKQDEYSLTGHDGGSEGANALMFYNPKTAVGALVFTNQDFQQPTDVLNFFALLASLIRVGEQVP